MKTGYLGSMCLGPKSWEESGVALYDYGFRIYNPGIARFLSVDPLAPDYPELTPYQFASNRPIDGIDVDGLEYLTYIVNWYDGMDEPEISMVWHDSDQHNSHGSLGRGVLYKTQHWKTNSKGLHSLDPSRSSQNFYERGAFTDYGLYFGATGLYKLNRNGKFSSEYDYDIPAVDAVDYGAWRHDKGYDAVGAAGAAGLLNDFGTIPADLLAIEVWSEIVELGVGGVDPYNNQEITQSQITAAKRGIKLFSHLIDNSMNAITRIVAPEGEGLLGIMRDNLSDRAQEANLQTFIDNYFEINEEGYHTRRDGYWRQNEDGNQEPIPLKDINHD